MHSMTVLKSFKLFPGNGIRTVVMAVGAVAHRLRFYCGEVGSGSSRFACRIKSKPWVTAGRKITDRPRAMAGLPTQSR